MKKKIIYAVFAAVLGLVIGSVGCYFFHYSTNVIPINNVQTSSVEPEDNNLGLVDASPALSGECINDIFPVTSGDVIVYNTTLNDYSIEPYTYYEGAPEPDSLSFRLTKKVNETEFEDVDVTIPNIAPNIYVWDGEVFIPAEIKEYRELKAGKNNRRAEYLKTVFTTEDGQEYTFERKSPEE